jgi:hypothetical protein
MNSLSNFSFPIENKIMVSFQEDYDLLSRTVEGFHLGLTLAEKTNNSVVFSQILSNYHLMYMDSYLGFFKKYHVILTQPSIIERIGSLNDLIEKIEKMVTAWVNSNNSLSCSVELPEEDDFFKF